MELQEMYKLLSEDTKDARVKSWGKGSASLEQSI